MNLAVIKIINSFLLFILHSLLTVWKLRGTAESTGSPEISTVSQCNFHWGMRVCKTYKKWEQWFLLGGGRKNKGKMGIFAPAATMKNRINKILTLQRRAGSFLSIPPSFSLSPFLLISSYQECGGTSLMLAFLFLTDSKQVLGMRSEL